MSSSSSSSAADAAASAGYQYNLIVLGGGSGGLACSKAAAELGANVVVLDYVKPSPVGTTWGLGGTCVNVGCIPKKLFHQASIVHQNVHDSKDFGWQVEGAAEGEAPKATLNWERLMENVQDHIRSLNWNYKVQLRTKKVKYMNALGEFVDAHTIRATSASGKQELITADHIVVAVGGRPKYPDIPGATEFGITSDDLFSLPQAPGKSLVVGASYVALECAGFLNHFKYDTTVMVRSILLRGFDQEIAEKIGAFMKDEGTKFIHEALPSSLEKTESGRILVKYTKQEGEMSTELTDEFDSVLFAIGREADVQKLGLANAGVQLSARNSKVIVDDFDRSNVENIYAIGDVAEGRPELTPVAIQAGKLLAKRLFGGSEQKMDYTNIPTAVFTPLEYGSCGLSEEAAEAKYGKDNIDVYHSSFQPLEWTVPHRPADACFCKVIVNNADDERILGIHILSPNAGEITQGFAIALKCGATKSHLDSLVGIHPTIAEEFTSLTVTKRSGGSSTKGGC